MNEEIICTYLLSDFGTNGWGNYLHSYSVASAGPSSEEDSMEHMELETRGIEMDSSNPSYKRQAKMPFKAKRLTLLVIDQ